MTEETPALEATMLYREPAEDSDEKAIQDIWGKSLEVRTVDASEVPEMLQSGWVRNPLDIGKSPEERAGFVRVERSEVTELRKEVEDGRKREGALNELLTAARATTEKAAAEAKAGKEEIERMKAEVEALQKDLDAATAPKSETVTENKTLSVKPKAG